MDPEETGSKPVPKKEPKELVIDIRLNKHQAIFTLTIISLIVIATVCYFTGLVTKAYESIYWADANISVIDKDQKPLSATTGLTNILKPKYTQQTTANTKGVVQITNLVQGDYKITLTKDGYITKTENLKLVKGHNLFHYTLEKVPAAKVNVTGKIQNYISEQPLSNIEIALGDRVVKTGANGEFSFTEVPTGELVISSKQAQYLPFSGKFSVSKTSSDIGKINLVPSGVVVFSSNRDNGKQAIYVSSYDGTDQKPLIARVGETEDTTPYLSSDNKKVIFTSTRDGKKDEQGNRISQLFIVDLDGKNLFKITDKSSIGSYSFTKDSKKIIWTSYLNNKSEAYIYDIVAKKNTQISSENNINSIVASPNSQKIAYSTRFENPSKYEVYIANIDGTNEEKVNSDSNFMNLNDFTENTKLLYSTFSSTINATKYLSYDLTAKVNTEVQFDSSKRQNGLKSPDGKNLAYIANRDGKNNVFISGLDGKNEKKLTTIDTVQGELSWSLDSKYLFFYSMKTGENAIYVVGIDGGIAKKITDASGGYGQN